MNPIYAGRLVYGRRSGSKYHRLEEGGVVRELAEGEVDEKEQMRTVDREKWVVVESTREPLVPKETFPAAMWEAKSRAWNDEPGAIERRLAASPSEGGDPAHAIRATELSKELLRLWVAK